MTPPRPGSVSQARPPPPRPASAPSVPPNGSQGHSTTPESEGRPSPAITSGADRILALMEGEQAKLTAMYAASLRTLEAELLEIQSKGARAVVAVEERAREAEREAAALRAEHARLLASIEAVGLEYSVADRELKFAPATTRIVEDFMLGARMQEEQMQGKNGAVGDTALFAPVGPAQFFGVLDNVLQKGRVYAEAIEQQHQQQQSESVATRSPSAIRINTTSGSTTGVKRPPSPFPIDDSPTTKHQRT